MRYFIIVSLILHTTLFASWQTTNTLSPQAGHSVSIALALQQQSSQKKAFIQDQVQKPDIENLSKTKELTLNSHSIQAGSEAEILADVLTEARVQEPIGIKLQIHLQQALVPYFYYPKLARKKGWQGTVELGVHIDTNGRLSNIRVLHSSGYGLLDHAAATSMGKLTGIPEVTQWQEFRGINITIPVQYQLIST